MATPIPANRAPFTLDELAQVTGGTVVGARSTEYHGVCTDTRALAPGCVFIALRGERFDGHSFAAAAAAAGAGLVIVDHALPLDVGQLVVPDTLIALGQLAGYHRRRWGGELIAIAGAAGKTTTRATTSALLEALYGTAVHSTPGNLNNQVGVPMVLFGLTTEHRFGVIEVGTNRTGEVPLLTSIVQPQVSILTLIDLEHSEGLGDLDAIEREEGAIFAETCHTFVVNGDDPRALRQAEERVTARPSNPPSLRRYGFDEGATLRAVTRRTSGTRGAELRIAEGERLLTLHVPIVGKPASYAVLAAVAAVEALVGRPLGESEIQLGLDSPRLQPEGRAELVAGPHGVLFVNDSYNANPASMRSALVTASELARERDGQLHLVLGEMRELGSYSHTAHADLGSYLAASTWSSLFAVGDQMLPLVLTVRDHVDQTLRFVDQRQTTAGIAGALAARLRPNDVVLVKGSRGVRTETVIAELLSEKHQ